MLKAVLVATLGGLLSGHLVRNGVRAMFLVVALIGAETTWAVSHHHHWSVPRDVGLFALLDTVGSSAMLVGEALSV